MIYKWPSWCILGFWVVPIRISWDGWDGIAKLEALKTVVHKPTGDSFGTDLSMTADITNWNWIKILRNVKLVEFLTCIDGLAENYYQYLHFP